MTTTHLAATAPTSTTYMDAFGVDLAAAPSRTEADGPFSARFVLPSGETLVRKYYADSPYAAVSTALRKRDALDSSARVEVRTGWSMFAGAWNDVTDA